MRFLFLGPPGAGKGTQAKIISEKLKIKMISTGDLLRENVKKGTELGKLAERYMKSGKLVPDDIMLTLIEREVKVLNSFILDGFPRTINQAKGLDDMLAKLNKEIQRVFYFMISDSEIIRRLSSRRVCPECNRNYNILFKPPQEDEICDVCKVKLFIREDDKEEVIKKRIEIFKENTFPLVEYYEKRGILFKINAGKEPEKVTEEILNTIKL